MKKNTLLIIPMLAPMLNISAAELPDEINFAPYQRTYEQASGQVDVISSSLDQSRSQLESAYNQESSISAQITSLEDNIYRTQNVIAQNEQERQRLDIIANDLNYQIGELDQRLTKAERRRNRLEREYNSEDQRLKPFRQKVRNTRKRVAEFNKVVDQENRKLKQLKNQRQTTKAALDGANANVVSLMEKMDILKQRLANIKKLIADKKVSIVTIKTDLEKAKKFQANQTEKLKKISLEIKALNDQLGALGDLNSPEAQLIRKQLKVKRTERKTQAAVVTQANTRVEKLKGKLSSEQGALSKLQSQQTTLPGEIAQLKTSIQASREKAKTLKAKLQQIKTNVEAQVKVVDTSVANANQASQRLTKAKQKLANESIVMQEIAVKLERLNNRIANMGQNLRSLNNNYNTTIQQIRSISQALPEYRRQLRDMGRDLQLANTDLINIQDSIITLNSDVTRLSSQLSSATTDRDLKYQEYISRYEYYSTQLAAAKTLGASQTDIAINIATTDSNEAVDNRSKSLGTQIGSDLANSQAKYWAAIRSEIKGYNDGYNTGYASAPDYQRGQEEGTRSGIMSAQNHAQTVLKPQFFNQFFEEALKTGQFKSLEKLSFTQIPMAPEDEFSSDFEKSSFSNNMDVAPITNGEVNISLDTRTGLDSSIASFKTNLGQVISEKATLADPNNAYENPSSIPFQSYDCSGVYKGVAEFKSACANEYAEVFSSKYRSEHSENFKAQYTNLFEGVVEDTRVDQISSIYQADLVKFYPIAKASGISDGKAQIYKETFAIAEENAYNTEIPKATAVAEAEASGEVKDWVANNASVTLKSSAIVDSNLRGGSDATLSLTLKNISSKATLKPVRVVVTSSKNVTVVSKEMMINNIEGNTTTENKDFKFKINSNVTSGKVISISGKVITPGGKYKAERVETFTVNATAVVNPNLAPQELTYDSTPKVKGWRRYKIHRFDIDITPAAETIAEGYTIEMTPTENANLVQMKTKTSQRTGKLRYGSNKRVSFSYVFKKAARDKVIPMLIKYIFKGKVMRSQIIELRPR